MLGGGGGGWSAALALALALALVLALALALLSLCYANTLGILHTWNHRVERGGRGSVPTYYARVIQPPQQMQTYTRSDSG